MNEFMQAQPQGETGGIGRSIMLLGLGIFIGSTLGITGCWIMGIGGGNHAPAHAQSAGAAGAMESLGAPPQTDLSQPAAASGYVDGYTDGHSVSAMTQAAPIQAGLSPNGIPMVQPPQPPVVHYVQTGMPITLPGQGPEIITTTTTYPSQVLDANGQPIGANGLRTNGCVDPPSVRGRAYSRTMQ